MADEKEGGVEVGMTTLFRQRGTYGPRRGACGWVLRSKGGWKRRVEKAGVWLGEGDFLECKLMSC